jgi:hypothetical protein
MKPLDNLAVCKDSRNMVLIPLTATSYGAFQDAADRFDCMTVKRLEFRGPNGRQ